MNLTPSLNKTENKKSAVFLSKYFKYVIPLVFILILAGGFLFIVKPRYEEIKIRISEANDKKKTELESLKQDLASLQKYKISFDKLDGEKKDRINKMIPSLKDKEYQNEDLFTDMATLVASQGLVLGSISINPEVKQPESEDGTVVADTGAPQLGKLTLKVNVLSVDYPGLKGLVYLLEHNLRLMDIKNIAFDPLTKKAELQIITYYYQ